MGRSSVPRSVRASVRWMRRPWLSPASTRGPCTTTACTAWETKVEVEGRCQGGRDVEGCHEVLEGVHRARLLS